MRTSGILIAAFAALSLLSTAPAFASDDGDKMMTAETVTVDGLEISGGWARAMLPGQKAGGGFVVITNRGATDDRLVGVRTPNAGHSEIHEMKVVDGVMKMRQIEGGLPIPAGETVVLEPGANHLMFMMVETPFTAGDTLPVTLVFEKAGEVDMMLPVVSMEKSKKMKMMNHD